MVSPWECLSMHPTFPMGFHWERGGRLFWLFSQCLPTGKLISQWCTLGKQVPNAFPLGKQISQRFPIGVPNSQWYPLGKVIRLFSQSYPTGKFEFPIVSTGKLISQCFPIGIPTSQWFPLGTLTKFLWLAPSPPTQGRVCGFFSLFRSRCLSGLWWISLESFIWSILKH